MDICWGLENFPITIENQTDDVNMPEEFQYSSTSVPSALCNLDNFDVQYAGCDCNSSELCASPSCSCISIKSMGIGSLQTILQEIIMDEVRQPPIFECNDSCTCDAIKCTNRVVQRRIKFQLSVVKTKDAGWGLKTLEPIPKSSFVVEYAGEILDHTEAKERTLAQSPHDNNYIHTLREHLACGKTLCTYVDPTHVGNIGRFINHSCAPNLLMIPVRINNAVPKLALFAKRDIQAQEELSFHYAGVQSYPSNEKQFAEVVDCTKLKPCFCNAPSCAGVLPFDNSIF